jgi:hypothetical protein
VLQTKITVLASLVGYEGDTPTITKEVDGTQIPLTISEIDQLIAEIRFAREQLFESQALTNIFPGKLYYHKKLQKWFRAIIFNNEFHLERRQIAGTKKAEPVAPGVRIVVASSDK